MKVDRTKSKRSSTEVPPDCKVVIERIKACETAVELFAVLSAIENWTYGKCELYHWIDVLDIFDSYLEQAAQPVNGSKWAIALDAENNEMLRCCVTYILNFTTLLIEHSFSRNLYNSMDHLVKLLNSVCIRMVLEVLQLLFMFSKRSNFLARLPEANREDLLERLTYIADSWGGMDAGYGLAECCTDHPMSFYPASARGIHMEFPSPNAGDARGKADSITVIHRDDVTELGSNPAVAMDALVEQYAVPEEKQIMLFTHLRLAFNFPNFSSRCQCVQARLQAISILVYTNALHDNFPQLLYGGLMDEIVELLRLESSYLTEIKAAGLRALTSVIHLDRVQNFPSIIDVTGIGSYHGFLPIMVRNCITSMITPPGSNTTVKPCPISLATALFSFIYHLASYELGGEALVSCGMLESLLKVVTWKPQDEDQITFVTRAVRVIDLITNMDMQGFHTHSGLNIFINRLEIEVADCRKEQPFEIIPEPSTSLGRQNTTNSIDQDIAEEGQENPNRNVENSTGNAPEVPMDTDSNAQMEADGPNNASTPVMVPGNSVNFVPSQHVCLPQRAALLKSLLNFLKKVIQDASFSDSIRHIMETSLPNSLRHILSNAEYYGSSLFLLATDVVTVYVFQEPSLLSALQDSGLTDVVQEAILVKEVPATREVIASIPNIFSALCLNNRGLNAFLKCKPFHKICKLLISPQYLAAMRRRRSAEPMGDTATNLGGAMDELMRHQPGLRAEATTAVVELLVDLRNLSVDTRYVWWKDHPPKLEGSLTTTRAGTSEVGSSEEDDDDDEPSISSQPQVIPAPSATQREVLPQPNQPEFGNKPPPPLTDYIFNVMKFLDAILSNNNTDDHCREFVAKHGIAALMHVLTMPYLPLDFPNTASCQAVSAVCKSILSLAREKEVLVSGMEYMQKALVFVNMLGDPLPHPGSSVLLRELASATVFDGGVIILGDPNESPILASMTGLHSLVMMFIQVCRTGQPEIRNMSMEQWGTEKGLKLLKQLSKVYLNLVFESTVLLAICSGEYKPGPGEFARRELDILVPPSKVTDGAPVTETSAVKEQGSNNEQMDVDTTDQTPSTTYVSSSTQTSNITKSDKANTTLQEYAKILKPVLSASSRLGRALAELFGLLVKLAIGSPMRQRRGMPVPNGPVVVSPYADSIATVLSELLAQGLRWEPIPTSPVPKLQLSICAVGFSSPLLFDEKRFPYHLMLKKFIDSDGLTALFDVFYWAISPESQPKGKADVDPNILSDQQIEFLDSWLVLVERFVNPKMVLESPHLLPAKNGLLTKRLMFNSNAFLGHVHKLAFKAILYLWKNKPIKLIGHRPADLMLSILCNILRHKEQSDSITRKAQGPNAPRESLPGSPISINDAIDMQMQMNLQPGISALPNDLFNLSDLDPIIQDPDALEDWMEDRSNTYPELNIGHATSQAGSSSRADGTASNVAESMPTDAPAGESAPTPVASSATGGNDLAPAVTNNQADVSNGNNTPATAAPTPTPTPTALGNSEALRALGLDPAQLQQLLDMGFPQSLCVEALISTHDIVQATDYLLNNVAGSAPVAPASASAPAAATRPVRVMPPLTGLPVPDIGGSPTRPRPMGDWAMEWDYSDEDIFRAIVMSMGENGNGKTKTQDEKTITTETLSSEEIDEFTADVFEKALELVEQVPESVFRVCELLVSVGNRKGSEWMTQTVKKLAHQTTSLIQAVNSRISSLEKEDLHQTADDTMLCIRLHLFSLVFEEVKATCYGTIESSGIIALALELLLTLRRVLRTAANKGTVLDVPKWTAPIILLLDLYEKAAIASRRKGLLAVETDHIWKWYDINSGKWFPYSTPNNHAIDKAFWDGESSVRIVAGRRRYGISFSGMVQLNEETSNRRPIALWLKQGRQDHPSMLRVLNNIQTKAAKEGAMVPPRKYVVSYRASCLPPRLKFYHYDKPMEVEEDLTMVNKEMLILHGLSTDSARLIITACVDFLRLPVEPDSLHAIMRLCLRLTRDYELALYFSELGGVSALLSLNATHHFNGFLPLANLIIRHCMEDPACLRFAVEKMIREKVCTPCAATCKELHYLLRVLAPIACRSPSIFVDVAKEILRVDIPFVTRRGLHVDEDQRLVVKTVPNKPESFRIHSDSADCARDVIQKLLVALVERYDDDDEETKKPPEPVQTARCSRPGGPGGAMIHAPTTIQAPRVDLIDPFEQMDLDAPSTSSASAQKNAKNEVNEKNKNNKPLITKCAILQLLAESVHSYTYACKIIAEYSFQGGSCKNVPEDCTALGFLLDHLGPLNQFLGNKDCNTILRDLLAGMAACNHLPDAQAIVISEVKAALHRLLVQRESQEKHLKIQYLLNLISYMIETCPSSVMTQFVAVKLPHVTTFNHVVRLLIKKNVVTDLARVVHHVDLSSKHLAQTLNASLKCLELISRVVNIPTQPAQLKPRPKSGSQNQDSDNNTHTMPTSNSEGTRAQGEEIVEDAENTEHDISAAAESLDPISEGHTQDHDNGEHDAFQEIMDQLLDRDNIHAEEVLNESQNSLMDTETTEAQRGNEANDGDYHVVDSDSSISSEPSSEGDEDDDDEEEDDDDHNGGADDDDDDDEDDEEGDGEDGLSNYDETADERLLRAPPLERDDEMLMVQYGAGDDAGPIFFTNNTTYNFNLGLFEETLMSDQSNVGLRLNHPLLQPPSAETTVHGAVSRHRTGRQRRYHYFQYINTRHPPPPPILQRLLGPSTAQDVIQLTTGQALNHQGNRDTRLLVMDASTDPNVNRTGATASSGTVSNFTALHWWCEEAKVLDGESMHDCIVGVKKDIVEAVEQERDEAFRQRREKKKADEELKKKSQEQSTSAMQTNTGSEPTTSSQPAGSSLLSSRPTLAPNRQENRQEPGERASTAHGTSAGFEGLRDTRVGLNRAWRQPRAAIELFGPTLTLTDEQIEEDVIHISQHIAAATGRTLEETVVVDDDESLDGSDELFQTRSSTATSGAENATETSGRADGVPTPTMESGSGRREVEGGERDTEQERIDRTRILSEALDAHSELGQPVGMSTTGEGLEESGQQVEENSSAMNSTVEQEPARDLQSGAASQTTSQSTDADPPLGLAGVRALIEETIATYGRPRPSLLSDEMDRIVARDAREREQAERLAMAVGDTDSTETRRHSQILVRDEAVAGPSGLHTQNHDFAEILGDIEIPEGVDPSFLAALPEDMRQEVIAEHLRVQRLSEQTSQAVLEAPAATLDVSPEFLAALPPNIQEEVLAQQRLEQQRRVATTANPNDPVDAEAFFRTLQPNLRQLILADMEESQMAVIPPEFAEEAQNLRRNWVTRNRQILQERLFQNHHHATSALSSILRHSGMRLTGRFGLHSSGAHRTQWPGGWIPRPPTLLHPNNIVNTKAKGKQLVDFETLSCLMVILFLDDPKINTGRLHRVIRNLCYHTQTRAWMIRSLLSIVEKSDDTFSSNANSSPGPLTMFRGRGLPKDPTKKHVTELAPTWLNISLDSALGCSGANVFQIHKHTGGTAKKLGSDHRYISIHPQAVTQIARHTIDALSNLAKSFPAQFLPYTAVEQDVKILNTDTCLTPESTRKTSTSCSPGRSKPFDSGDLLFWDFLLKLDSAASGKKGKSLAKMGLNTAPTADAPQATVTFDASPFGRLIKMLGYQFIRHKQIMMDKILRLLSLISLGVPENTGYGKKVYLEEPQPPLDESRLISEPHLRLIIEVITSKYCSEEGLEDATSLLLNLSYGPTRMRHKVTALLTEGVQELGKVVCSDIKELMKELKALQVDSDKEEDVQASTSTEAETSEKVFKGMITDRFTKETVVITSATKPKAAYELQLPSMSSLTSKTSSQAFFLRLLKLVMSLRGFTRGAIRKHKRDATSGSASGTSSGSQPVIQPSTNESPHTQRRRENLNRFMARHLAIVGGSGSRGTNSANMGDMFMEVALPEPTAAALNSMQEPTAPTTSVVTPVAGTSNAQGPKKDENSTDLNIKNETVIDEDYLLPRLSIELQLDELWETLSECLLSLGHMPDHHAVLVLQPAVEAFFLVHTVETDDHYKRFCEPARAAQLAPVDEEHVAPDPAAAGDMPDDAEMVDPQNCTGIESTNVTTDLPPDTQKFLSFAETHRTVLNHILRQSTMHLADGPFAVLVDHTRVLDFDIKRRYFRAELERLDDGVRREDLAVHVRRQHVFEDSFRELHRKSAEEWKNRFYIVFEGEEGQDAGGLLREWYVIISREIFNPMYALFTISPGDRVTYMINSSSHCNSNHLFYFKFVGRVIAKAIYDNKLLECYFTRSFYKHILGKYVKHIDMESEDYAFFQGLAFLMDNHISELGYDVTFSTEVQEFGVTEVRDLIPNGRNIPVSEENKMEYVRLVCQMKMTGAIRKQLNAFLEGFYDIIPKRLISIFNEQELELLVSGLPNVDIEDLKANTEYHKYHGNSLQIQWFWRALRSFDQADRAKFLQFVTGTSKVPLQGFGSLEGMNGVQKFQIHRDDRSTDRLPSAHTCFNQLDLPAYETYDKLRTYMMKAIHECSEGFGFA